MIRFHARLAGILIAVVIFATISAVTASANTYAGTVRNGTTGKLAPGVDVILLSLQGGMEAVANAKTDAQGHYQFNYTPTGQMPMMVRATYKGVLFHAVFTPGSSSADVQVYEPTSNADAVQFPGRLVVFQPEGSTLHVAEEFQVQNESKPPVAYFKQDGDFEFETPAGVDKLQVSVQGPEKMLPLVQGTMDRGANRHAIAYAFRPGESDVMISYQVPYQSNAATLQLPSVYSANSLALLVPPTMTLSAPGFQPAGTNEGMAVYVRDAVPAGATIPVSISGTAPPPTDNSGTQGQPGGDGRDAGVAVTAVPPKLDTLKWVLVGGFAALFMLGAAYLFRKPLPVVAGSAAPVEVATAHSPRQKPPKAVPVAVVSQSESTLVSHAEATISAVDREVGMSLDQLKDTLFKLELRHQAGTISDEDYAEQRARAEKILRDLVRG